MSTLKLFLQQHVQGFATLACVTASLLIQERGHAQALIAVDLLGYRPEDIKIAVVKEFDSETFEVVDITTNLPVYTAKIRGDAIRDESTGDITYIADFTGLKTPGKYQLWLPGTTVRSNEFRIHSDVYRSAALASLESYYYQRCGVEVNNGTIWRHAPCHINDAVFFDNPSSAKDMIGGWHDAGDYGKFVTTATLSVAFLMYLYETEPTKFSDHQLLIPEVGNGIPDILDEVRWELTWLLKMQREDGGVYHKVSTKKWTGEYLPHRDTGTRYIFRVSSTATGAFAAVTALGARSFKKWDPEFAHVLLKASVNAWSFLDNHREIVPPGGFENPPGVVGGAYADENDVDERLWASVELYRLTGNTDYHKYFLANYTRFGGVNYPISWRNVQNFAYYSYLQDPRLSSNQDAQNYIVSTLKGYSDNLVKRIEGNGYRCVLKGSHYYWGSNGVALGFAFDLIQAYEVTREPRYLSGALDVLHYILGRNAFSLSFVTGVGSNAVTHPYHQFSMTLRKQQPVPGMLVGGPNKYSKLRGKVLSEYPAKSYEDSEKNYFVNETAIYWTAPFVFVAGYFSKFEQVATEDTRTTDNN